MVTITAGEVDTQSLFRNGDLLEFGPSGNLAPLDASPQERKQSIVVAEHCKLGKPIAPTDGGAKYLELQEKGIKFPVGEDDESADVNVCGIWAGEDIFEAYSILIILYYI